MYLKSYDPEVFCYHLYIYRIAVLYCLRERGGHHPTLDPVWGVLLGCTILCVMETFLPKMPCWIMWGLEQRFPGVPIWFCHLPVQSCAINVTLLCLGFLTFFLDIPTAQIRQLQQFHFIYGNSLLVFKLQKVHSYIAQRGRKIMQTQSLLRRVLPWGWLNSDLF